MRLDKSLACVVLLSMGLAAAPATQPAVLKLRADTPENVKAFIKECEANKPKLVEKCKADVKAAKAAVNMAMSKGVGRQAVLAAKASLKQCEDRLKAVQDGSVLLAAPHLGSGVGKIGTETGYSVVQIIDARNMLAHPLLDTGLTIVPVEQTVWYEDFDTTGMTDKSGSMTELLLENVGTKQYTTADGSTNTVNMVRPFDINKYLEK